MERDFELLAAWRAGDDGAGNELFEQYFEKLYGFFDRKLSRGAPDLVQQTFLLCLEGLPRFREDCSFLTFLYAVARHALLRHWRAVAKDRALDFSVSSLADLRRSPSSHVARKEVHGQLREALETLPLDLQLLVELHYWEGLRGPELARVLEIPEGTVRSRLRRALTLLRARLEERAVPQTASGEELDLWALGAMGARRPAPRSTSDEGR